MKNILTKAGDDLVQITEQDMGGTAPAQRTLFERSKELGGRVDNLIGEGNYSAALREIAALRPQVDAFFDQVVVNDADPEVRFGRLRLLRAVVTQFSTIADFSEIVVAG